MWGCFETLLLGRTVIVCITEAVEDQFSEFLDRHCPNPAVIRNAISRTNLWTIHDRGHLEQICSKGERATACWLILQGPVEIQSDHRNVTFRKAGDLVGEQAFLHTLSGRNGVRTADMIACGAVRLACIDAAFQERLTHEERVLWILTLADVVNHRLEEATSGRSTLRKTIDENEALLRRFADGDALGIVKLAADDRDSPIQDRTAIVFFSDIANFSSWATGRPPHEVATIARRLATIQIDIIRAANGTIDKVIGDGVMAYWFVDTRERESTVPNSVLGCARAAIDKVREAIRCEGFDLDIRIGIHVGPVAFGDFGATDRIAVTVLGETVNLAARFEQAKNGELGPLRISPELRMLAEKAGGDLSRFKGPIPVEVKHGLVLNIFSI
jgi:class 3 adenylate cyclase